MQVVQVRGTADGVEITFEYNEEWRTWDATVPANLAGKYNLEICVEDEAGNRANIATAVYVADVSGLRISFSMSSTGVTMSLRDFLVSLE